MACEVVYAEVSPKERVHFTSQTSDTGDPTTYAEVNVKWRSDRPDSTPKTTHTGFRNFVLGISKSIYAIHMDKCYRSAWEVLQNGDRKNTEILDRITVGAENDDATCSENSHWCYVAVALYFTAVILLITVILLAVKCHHL